jgi:hypothetical protein
MEALNPDGQNMRENVLTLASESKRKVPLIPTGSAPFQTVTVIASSSDEAIDTKTLDQMMKTDDEDDGSESTDGDADDEEEDDEA